MNDFVWLDGDIIFDGAEQKQLPIDDKSKNRLIDVRVSIFNTDVDNLAEKLFVGDVTIGAWEEKMKQLIRELHSSVAAIGKGGWDQMTWSDWGRLGPVLKEQYKYLHQFAQKIADTRDTISLRAIQAQARMYGDSARKSVDVTIPLPIEKQLPWMPRANTSGRIGMDKGDGTDCRMHCCCFWQLKIIKKQGDFNIVEAVWKLSPAEHCDTCIERDGYTTTLKVYKDIPVPEIIGDYCGK